MKKLKNKASFYLLQYGLYRLLWFTALTRPEFKKRLLEKNFIMQMKTEDGHEGRFFIVSQGKFISTMEKTFAPDFCLVWKDEETGAKIMGQIVKGTPKALYKAVMKGELKLTGEAVFVGWFLETMNQLGKAYKGIGKKKNA